GTGRDAGRIAGSPQSDFLRRASHLSRSVCDDRKHRDPADSGATPEGSYLGRRQALSPRVSSTNTCSRRSSSADRSSARTLSESGASRRLRVVLGRSTVSATLRATLPRSSANSSAIRRIVTPNCRVRSPTPLSSSFGQPVVQTFRAQLLERDGADIGIDVQ